MSALSQKRSFAIGLLATGQQLQSFIHQVRLTGIAHVAIMRWNRANRLANACGARAGVFNSGGGNLLQIVLAEG
jgi:hypothetical protein